MNMIVVKLLVACLLCELTSFAAGVPVNYRDTASRNKRTPANNFSFFGIKPASFSIPNPILSAQQTFNQFGNLLSPNAASRNRNNESVKETSSFINNRNPQREAMPPQIGHREMTTVTSPPEPLTTTKGAIQNVQINKRITNVENEKDNTNIQKAQENQTPGQDNNTNNKDVNISEIDQKLVEAIFNDVRDSTTTDDTTDYTTETGDYESTTSLDELLRIPAPVVASLLG